MKISPIAGNGAAASVNPDEGRSASSDRLARAVAIAQGQTEPVQEPVQQDPQVTRAETSIKKIKMRTQRSPEQLHQPVEAAPLEPAATVEPVQSDTLNPTEQVEAATEETKPLSPQFAALAKERRAVQLERKALEAEKAALKSNPEASGYTKEQIKANALGILREAGVTNDELTEAVLREAQDYGPGFTKLESEFKTLKEAFENQNKSLTEREAANEAQVISVIRKNVDALVAQGEDFETVREAGYASKAVDLIHKTFKATGEILDETEALQLIENELLEEILKFGKIKKVQSRLAPAPQEIPAPAVKQDRPGTKVMKTLTNRDGTSSISMSRRERAIAAMEGRLKT